MSNLKVLHIANDFSGSAVYKNLVKVIDSLGVVQIIYTPLRNSSLIGRNELKFKVKGSEIIYSPILSIYSRFNFLGKIKKISMDIKEKTNLDKISVIHAHTWYSDGAVAYELNKTHEIEYIVTVRSTDLNIFFKYMLHLRCYGINILKNAKKIIFISPVYLNRLYNKPIFAKVKPGLISKSEVLPNGIDSFWIENIRERKKGLNSPVQLIYIGKFNKGKNVIRLLKATNILNEGGLDCHLHLVGGGGMDENKILKIIENKDLFTFHGKIKDKEVLAKLIYSCDIFTMPSHHETFGLVYIEALSQGIPVIFTKNEGIYGYYENVIGEAVNSRNIDSIAEGINKIVSNYSQYSFEPRVIIPHHNWKKIAADYLRIYTG